MCIYVCIYMCVYIYGVCIVCSGKKTYVEYVRIYVHIYIYIYVHMYGMHVINYDIHII